MKVDKNKIGVTDVFEIQMRVDMWVKIADCAKRHDVTFSWVTRFCLFEVLKKYADVLNEIELQNYLEKDNLLHDKEQKRRLHRHKLCLHGNDAVHVRFVAHKLGLTISQLLRVCVRMYIQLLFAPIERSYLVQNGIKFLESVVEKHDRFTKTKFDSGKFRRYSPSFGRYWGWIFDYGRS